MSYIFNINVCRACMENDQSYDLMAEEDLLEKFEFTTRLQVSKEDHLPKAICCRCISRLKVAYYFIKTAQESENNLKTFLDKISSEFKEVTQGNKSCKKFSKENNYTEEDLLSLINEENRREISLPAEVNGNRIKKDGIETQDENLNFNAIQNIHDERTNNQKNETCYNGYKDVLLIGSSNDIESVYENNSNLMDVSTSAAEVEKSDNEEVENDNELADNQTYGNINLLCSNDESEIHCKSVELAVEESEENHECGMIINSQESMVQCQQVYIDESSIEETNEIDNDDHFNVNNFKEVDKNTCKRDCHRETLTKSFDKREDIHRFYCNKCNRDFSTKTNLNRHMQSHEGNKPFSCMECEKSFTQKSTLKQHMYTHTGERPYVCDVCNRGFTQCKSLIFHMRRHTGEKPFHCEYCLITFRQKDALRNHILKHHVVIERAMDGNEIFSCIICQKKFETKFDFKTHMKVHTATGEVDNVVELFQDEEKKIKRNTKNLRDADFIDSEYYNAAVVNISASSAAEPSRAKKFQCRKCFKCFALRKSLVRHMRIHYARNDDALECFECDLKFSSTQMYQEHMSICHQYACASCPPLVFKTIQELKIHMIEHELSQQEE